MLPIMVEPGVDDLARLTPDGALAVLRDILHARLLGNVMPAAHLVDLHPWCLRLPENPNDLFLGKPLLHLQALPINHYHEDSQTDWLRNTDSGHCFVTTHSIQ